MADYYGSRSYARPHHDSSSYYSRSRDTNPYSRHAHYSSSPTLPASKLTAMRSSVTPPSPSNRYAARSSYSSYYRPDIRRTPKWPPSPSAEDEATSLSKEVQSDGSALSDDGNGVLRGTVDQNPILEEVESADRRFVLVSDPSADDSASSTAARDRRRKSFAERGGLQHLNTDVKDPPVLTERISTPYAYKPQKEKLDPTEGGYFLSPESTIPSSASIPRSVPSRDAWSDSRSQNTNPRTQNTASNPIHSRYDSFTQSSRTQQNDVFEETDSELEDTTHLRTERKPARYSFVKSDSNRERLRTDLNGQNRPQSTRRDSGSRHRTSRNTVDGQSSGSSKSSSQAQSPRSSSSSVNDASRRTRQATGDTGYTSVPHPSTRPASPLYRDSSPKLPPRRPASPNTSRPPSRSGTGPPSPLSHSTTLPTPSSGGAPVTEADWHSTFPGAPPVDERPRPSSRYGRQESIPVPAPRIGVQSPSPARPPKAENPLPYPVDDRPGNVFMPPEEHYQYDHATNSPIAAAPSASPRQLFPESPKIPSSSIPPSPRERSVPFRPSMGTRQTAPEDLPRMSRTRSSSLRSQSSAEGRRERPNKAENPLSLGKPLPSCPRGTPSRHDDWFTLENAQGFDVCPSCYEGVFGETPFNVYFAQTRRYERPTERVCDFSSPWVRLAWLLTIKQRRASLEFLYALADIQATTRPCPLDRELSMDRADWYGIADPRDGVHVANFAVCSCDVRMIEALFPSIRGYFTRLPPSAHMGMPDKYLCSLRITSRRFPKYLDLLVELDAEAQLLGQRPDIARFVKLARDNAFKGECNRGKASFRKPWYYIPNLPELTVCEECYDDVVWPAMQSKTMPSTIPRLFNKAIQMVPGEDPDTGSSCCLWSPRMRRIFDTSVKEEDLAYLKRKAIDRKRAEIKLGRERKGIVKWMAGLERGSREWERAKAELREVEKEWAVVE